MASTISAGTTSGTAIAIAGDTSGNLALLTQAGANTITVPNATGTMMVSGNMPAFSAYLSADQTVSASAFVKVLLDTESFDTNNNFASSRFTPTIAGYYQISAGLRVPVSTTPICVIYKNGSAYARGSYTAVSTYNSVASVLVYCNGSTDYIELYGYTNLTTFSGIQSETFMSGVLVRAA